MGELARRPGCASSRGAATNPKRLLRTREAAAYLSVSAWKLRCLVADGKLPVVQSVDGSPFLFDLRDLDEWAERHKRTAMI